MISTPESFKGNKNIRMWHKTKENLMDHCSTCFLAYAAMPKDKSGIQCQASSKK